MSALFPDEDVLDACFRLAALFCPLFEVWIIHQHNDKHSSTQENKDALCIYHLTLSKFSISLIAFFNPVGIGDFFNSCRSTQRAWSLSLFDTAMATAISIAS